MALLPLPALIECAHAHPHNPSSPSLGSWGALPSVKLFLHKPIQSRKRGYKLAIASLTEVQKHPHQRPSHSSKHFADSSISSSSTKETTRSPSSWKPSHKKSNKHASSSYRPFLRQDSQRGGRGSYWAVEDGESIENSSKTLAQGTAMARIVEKLRDIQRTLDSPEHAPKGQPLSSKQNAEAESRRISRISPTRTAGELFLPKPNENLFSIGNYWSTPDHPIPAPGRGALATKFAWDFKDPDRQEEEDKKKRVKPPTLAELIIPPDQLRRLRTLGIALTNPVRVGRLGITDNIADKIIGQWRSQELVKVKCGGPAATNMMKIHKDLERKTGGLVVWRAGSVAIVYRGSDYDGLNKVATTLEKKLDGLLSSENYLQKALLNVDATKGLSKINEVRSDSSLNTGGSELQFNVMPNDLRKDDIIDSDAIFLDSTSSVNREGISPDTGKVKDTQETVLSSQVDASSVVEQPTEAGNEERDHAITTSEPAFIYRKLNVAPDPFVDRDYEIEVDNILESLGPRCQNWTGATPVPVDADLLLPLVPNHRPPYRLLPYGVKPHLTNNEQTDLRRLVRHITPHFVLGRNRGQQGLAAAILKLWEKTEVVKIAVKSGVQNTSSEKMAEELKRCTGGVILARDRYFITLYRGKDFLPQQVAFALTERTTMLRNLTEEDETVEGGISTINPSSMAMMKQKEERAKVKAEAEEARRLALAKQLEIKLALALEKKGKAEKDLEMLEAFSTPVKQPADLETITAEEKYMFRRLGLKMKPFLLIGRRGVFNGVVENMHLHWKHRELVKLIVKERDRAQLQKTARILEKESGGVLITVEGTSKGQAIIIYRGKNYERPENLRPKNLLDKKKALERSLEVQRRESLSRQISVLEREINKLKSSLSDTEEAKDDVLDAALDEFSISSGSKEKGLPVDEQGCTHVLIKDFSGEESLAQAVCADKKELLKLVQLGPIYRATRLSNLERLKLRKLAIKLSVGARFNVGKSNMLLGLARAIRIHFLKHAFAVIGIKNRGRGTSTQDLVHELEDLTGGVLISHEQKEIIMYRGWPKGEKMPTPGAVENVSPELLAALEADTEEDWDTNDDISHMTETHDVSDDYEGDSDDEDNDEELSVMTEASDIYDNVDNEDHLSMPNDVSDDDDEEDHWRMPETSDLFDNNDREDHLSMTEDVSDDDDDHLSMLLADVPRTDAEEGYAGAESLDNSTGTDEEAIAYMS